MWIYHIDMMIYKFLRFNRYMVECEFAQTMGADYYPASFNRYMVECEYDFQKFLKYSRASFNRYMVECE